MKINWKKEIIETSFVVFLCLIIFGWYKFSPPKVINFSKRINSSPPETSLNLSPEREKLFTDFDQFVLDHNSNIKGLPSRIKFTPNKSFKLARRQMNQAIKEIIRPSGYCCHHPRPS